MRKNGRGGELFEADNSLAYRYAINLSESIRRLDGG